jgi:von Willebrand factor type A domain
MQSSSPWFSKQKTQSLIAFSVSTCVHLTLCLALALILTSTQGSIGRASRLAFEPNDESGTDEVTQFELTPETIPSDTIQPSFESPAISTNAISASMVAAHLDSRMEGGGAYGNVAAMATKGAELGMDNAGPRVSKSKASFFGAHAEGNRFVFVIDSSRSMLGPRWEALCKELMRAIKSLSPDQEFFVISFDSLAHPMFGIAPPKGKFLTAVDKNFERIQNWLRSIRHGSNTYPASAVGIAIKLEPDAIFLLSDGEISDSTIEDLRIWNRKRNSEDEEVALIPIHTVLLHSQVGFVALETIAHENGGTFTPVQPR